LTLSGVRAKELGIAQEFAANREEMAKIYGVDLQDFKVFKRTTTDRVVHILNLPLITGLLVIVGLISLYVEFSAPCDVVFLESFSGRNVWLVGSGAVHRWNRFHFG
jgi:membrane-bound serine protease (ClpP class)